jgi:DNA repair exonuclease SbcCD ATPase subunit
MGNKFRSSLFGFNKEDVYGFVFKAKESETALKEQVSSLSDKLSVEEAQNLELNEQLNKLQADFDEASKKLDDFKNREESLTRLSESIGKLYLVANSNAKSILDSAKENTAIINSLNDSSIDIAENTNIEFEEISKILSEKSNKFIAEIEELKSRLNVAKIEINNNKMNIDSKTEELEGLIKNKELAVSK